MARSTLSARDRTGDLVGGRYRVRRMIGSGGQSTVWEAVDERAGDRVALKVLSSALASDADHRERMFREARAMASLMGTAAVRVLDQQWTDDGALTLVLEFLEGQELEDHLLELEARGERLPARDVVRILEPVARTVDAAHAQGIIHRDLKPGNVFLLGPGGAQGVRVLDFGFAKFERLRGLTAAGVIAGSPSYIAPEAWKGLGIDHRVDHYALGAIVFRMLTGRPPFVSDDLAELLRMATRAARPSVVAVRSDLAPEIDAWMEQALAVDPAARFVRAAGMLASLRQILGA